MSGQPAVAGGAAARTGPSGALLVGLLLLGNLTALSVMVWGHPGAAIAPVGLVACGWALWKAPLRASASVLVLVLLAADVSTNAEGLWQSPFVIVGDVLRLSLRTFVPALSAMAVTGLEAATVLLLMAAAWRRARGERVAGHVSSPPAVFLVGLLYVAAIGFAILNGLAHGGSAATAVWQTRPLLVTAGLFLVFEAAFRGPADHALIGKIIVLAASVRALMALWIRLTVVPHAPLLDYATDHGDSMLFSLAAIILVADLLERTDRKRIEAALVFLPLVLAGTWANDRRTAWFQLALGLAVFFVVARAPRWKRTVGRLALAALPAAGLYLAAGWNATGPLFAPVQVVRSVADSRVDTSTWNRQVENWNVAMSMRDRPVLGLGFGHEWTEWFKGDDIAAHFERYRAQPHNQLLGLLLFGGAVAFAGIWTPFAVLVLLAARAYPRARDAEERAAALCVAAAAVVIPLQCYSDLGPLFHQYWVLTGLALAVGGKLAVATGAWR